MTKRLQLLKGIYSFLSLCIAVLGILLLVTPNNITNKLIYIIGIILIIYGFIKIISYFSKDLLQLAYQYDFALGITSMLIGFFIIFWRQDSNITLSRIISITLILESSFKIQTSFDGKRIGIATWLVMLLISIISCIIGILFFILSFSESNMVIIFMSINLIIYGIINFFVVKNTAVYIQEK